MTNLVDERTSGVHLSCDDVASLIAPYRSKAALVAARAVDARVRALLATVARLQPAA